MKTFILSTLPDVIDYNNTVYIKSDEVTDTTIKVLLITCNKDRRNSLQNNPTNTTIQYYNPLS